MNRRGNFFLKNRRGQFFIIMAMVIIILIAGFVSVTNSVDKKSNVRFYRFGDELKFEGDKVLNYGIKKNFDSSGMKSLFTNFTENYSVYSPADNFYYLFGDSNTITFAGLIKKDSGTINVDFDGVGSGTDISLSQGVYKTQDITSPTSSGNLTIDGTIYPFSIRTGQNFYFMVSQKIEGNVYTTKNN